MSAIDLCPLAERMLRNLPPYYATDPSSRALVDAGARELERIEAAANALRDKGAFPTRADDEYRFLGLWEAQMGLPVEPADATIQERQQLVAATWMSRKAASALAWRDSLQKLIGTTSWAHAEQTPEGNRLTITLPYVEGGFTAGQVIRLARALTPAHVDLVVAYDQGFLVDISLVDVEPI